MTLTSFMEEYNQLSANEQGQFAEAIRKLFSEGLIWREEESDRRIYYFITRHKESIKEYLSVAGWELRHDDRLGVFQATHSEGAHRRKLLRETTIWLLLVRLIYAEKRERLEVTLTRYPVASIAEITQRYSEFFPGQVLRKKGSLDDALKTLNELKLIRAAGGGVPRVNETESLIELLPTLETVVPSADVSMLEEKIREYTRVKEEPAEL